MRPLQRHSTFTLEAMLLGLIKRGEHQRAAEIQALLERRRTRPRKKRVVLPIMPRPYEPYINWRSTIDEVCARRGISIKALMTTSRLPADVEARWEIWWTIKTKFGSSDSKIGRRLGGFDHATVAHGIRAWQKRLDEVKAAA